MTPEDGDGSENQPENPEGADAPLGQQISQSPLGMQLRFGRRLNLFSSKSQGLKPKHPKKKSTQQSIPPPSTSLSETSPAEKQQVEEARTPPLHGVQEHSVMTQETTRTTEPSFPLVTEATHKRIGIGFTLEQYK